MSIGARDAAEATLTSSVALLAKSLSSCLNCAPSQMNQQWPGLRNPYNAVGFASSTMEGSLAYHDALKETQDMLGGEQEGRTAYLVANFELVEQARDLSLRRPCRRFVLLVLQLDRDLRADKQPLPFVRIGLRYCPIRKSAKSQPSHHCTEPRRVVCVRNASEYSALPVRGHEHYE